MSLDVVRPTTSSANDKQKPTYAYHMVRTDSKEQKLDAFMRQRTPVLPPVGSSLLSTTTVDQVPSSSQDWEDVENPISQSSQTSKMDTSGCNRVMRTGDNREAGIPHSGETAVGLLARKRKARKTIVLTSVLELLESVKAKHHRGGRCILIHCT